MLKQKPAHLRGRLIELIPANRNLRCEFCGGWTWWRRSGQRTLGTCQDCCGWWYQPTLPGLDLGGAVANLLAAFPGSEVSLEHPVPAGYQGPDAGPCRGCHLNARVYGALAFPYCRQWWEARRAQP